MADVIPEIVTRLEALEAKAGVQPAPGATADPQQLQQPQPDPTPVAPAKADSKK